MSNNTNSTAYVQREHSCEVDAISYKQCRKVIMHLQVNQIMNPLPVNRTIAYLAIGSMIAYVRVKEALEFFARVRENE